MEPHPRGVPAGDTSPASRGPWTTAPPPLVATGDGSCRRLSPPPPPVCLTTRGRGPSHAENGACGPSAALPGAAAPRRLGRGCAPCEYKRATSTPTVRAVGPPAVPSGCRPRTPLHRRAGRPFRLPWPLLPPPAVRAGPQSIGRPIVTPPFALTCPFHLHHGRRGWGHAHSGFQGARPAGHGVWRGVTAPTDCPALCCDCRSCCRRRDGSGSAGRGGGTAPRVHPRQSSAASPPVTPASFSRPKQPCCPRHVRRRCCHDCRFRHHGRRRRPRRHHH